MPSPSTKTAEHWNAKQCETAKPVLVLFLTAAVVASCGSSGGTAATATHTVDIDMRDISYSPNRATVAAGEAVRFVFHNRGKVAHDAFIGDEQAQMDHEKAMGSSMGGMHHGGGGDALTVKPGKAGALTHTFRAGDQLLIGCHELGHYAAGMKVALGVT